MSGRKKKTKSNPPLPRYIRDELRMTVALKGYSSLKTSKARRLPEQYEYMHKFFHGKVPSHPAQIKLLAEGHLNYRDLYDVVNVNVTKKKVSRNQTPPSALKLKLKDILTNYSSRSFYSGEDIFHLDLEKKNKSGPTLITGRNLHAMAIRGAREYKKAVAFANHKWDCNKLEPKKSGDTIHDVVEYVRQKMYYEKMKGKGKHKDVSDDDTDDEHEDDEESLSTPSTSLPPDNTAEGITSPAASTTEHDNLTTEKKSSTDIDISSEDESNQEENEIPSDYLFPSFYVFVLHGPFVAAGDQLDINLIENKDKKKGEGTRAQQRKAEAKEKEIDAKGDTSSKRGFTTDQRIDIESLGLRKESMIDRKHEVAMVALSMEESAMTKMIEAAERRAMQRCPEYDKCNQYWAKVDMMLKEQDQLMIKIRNFNEKIMNQKPAAHLVSDFLNNPSPDKKRKAIEIAIDDDVSDISSNRATLTEVSNN